MATTHTPTPPTPDLLAIPGEIRNAIYRMLLTNTYAHKQNQLIYTPLYPTILRTNRQIHQEAINILHGENIWITATVDAGYWPIIATTMPNVSNHETSNIKYPAMQIKFANAINTEATQPSVTFIMGEEEIEHFLQSLWRTSVDENTEQEFRTSSLTLTLCETTFHTKSKLQSTCLKPFGLVCGFRKLIIQGLVEPVCVERFLHGADVGSEVVAQTLSVSQAYLDKGDEEYFAGDFRRAVIQYSHGSGFLHHVYWLKLVEEGIHKPFLRDMGTVMSKKRVMDSHMVRAAVALGLYESAKTSGNRILADHILPPQARVHLRLCTARAHRALGEKKDESRLFEEALNAEGDKSTVLTALAELFPNAAPEQAGLLVEQRGKLQSGKAIDFDIIRAFWEAV